jgi:hypothetical protein
MVRLKVASDEALLEWMILFQFHNGSIKSAHEKHQKRQKKAFQFHNGSIKQVSKMFLKKLR